MSTPGPTGLSRRAWLSLLGSGAILASAGLFWRRRTTGAEAAPPRPRGVVPYADHEGWMVTPAEKQRLAAAASPAAP